MSGRLLPITRRSLSTMPIYNIHQSELRAKDS
jgi:hypothetical protein